MNIFPRRILRPDPVYTPEPDAIPVHEIDLGPLPLDTGVLPMPGSEVVATPQGAINSLMAIRRSFPNLAIIPFPRSVVVVALTANNAKEIMFPDGTVLFQLFSNGNFYASINGNADIATAATETNSRALFKPTDMLFHTMGKNISVITADANVIVSAACWTPDQFPAYSEQG